MRNWYTEEKVEFIEVDLLNKAHVNKLISFTADMANKSNEPFSFIKDLVTSATNQYSVIRMGKFILATFGDRVVGMAYGNYFGISMTIDIQCIYVDEDYRNLGIGRQLIQELTERLVEGVPESFIIRGIFCRALLAYPKSVAIKFGIKQIESKIDITYEEVDSVIDFKLVVYYLPFGGIGEPSRDTIRGYCCDIVMFDSDTAPDKKQEICSAINFYFRLDESELGL